MCVRKRERERDKERDRVREREREEHPQDVTMAAVSELSQKSDHF